MLLRSIAIALGLIFVSWGTALYAATHKDMPPVVPSVEIGEPVILHLGAIGE